MILLDTNYLIGALVVGSEESKKLLGWLDQGHVLQKAQPSHRCPDCGVRYSQRRVPGNTEYFRFRDLREPRSVARTVEPVGEQPFFTRAVFSNFSSD